MGRYLWVERIPYDPKIRTVTNFDYTDDLRRQAPKLQAFVDFLPSYLYRWFFSHWTPFHLSTVSLLFIYPTWRGSTSLPLLKWILGIRWSACWRTYISLQVNDPTFSLGILTVSESYRTKSGYEEIITAIRCSCLKRVDIPPMKVLDIIDRLVPGQGPTVFTVELTEGTQEHTLSCLDVLACDRLTHVEFNVEECEHVPLCQKLERTSHYVQSMVVSLDFEKNISPLMHALVGIPSLKRLKLTTTAKISMDDKKFHDTSAKWFVFLRGHMRQNYHIDIRIAYPFILQEERDVALDKLGDENRSLRWLCIQRNSSSSMLLLRPVPRHGTCSKLLVRVSMRWLSTIIRIRYEIDTCSQIQGQVAYWYVDKRRCVGITSKLVINTLKKFDQVLLTMLFIVQNMALVCVHHERWHAWRLGKELYAPPAWVTLLVLKVLFYYVFKLPRVFRRSLQWPKLIQKMHSIPQARYFLQTQRPQVQYPMMIILRNFLTAASERHKVGPLWELGGRNSKFPETVSLTSQWPFLTNIGYLNDIIESVCPISLCTSAEMSRSTSLTSDTILLLTATDTDFWETMISRASNSCKKDPFSLITMLSVDSKTSSTKNHDASTQSSANSSLRAWQSVSSVGVRWPNFQSSSEGLID